MHTQYVNQHTVLEVYSSSGAYPFAKIGRRTSDGTIWIHHEHNMSKAEALMLAQALREFALSR